MSNVNSADVQLNGVCLTWYQVGVNTLMAFTKCAFSDTFYNYKEH